MFVYILRHLFTYLRLELGLFTQRDRLGQFRTPYLFTYTLIRLHMRA